MNAARIAAIVHTASASSTITIRENANAIGEVAMTMTAKAAVAGSYSRRANA
jgi:hypothetical protein